LQAEGRVADRQTANARLTLIKEIAMNRSRLSVSLVVLIIAAALVAVVLATGSSAKKGPAVPANSAIAVHQTSLGRTLTDANGRTLYLFAGDRSNVSTLSAAGRAFWPPFTSTVKPSATGGAVASDVGTVKGAAGVAQVTYNGHPLYYFVGDHNTGQTTGQGLNQFGARWYVLSTSGAAITSAPKASASSTSTGGGSAYGY
jgi:predicted lipoprotein with Yx(FWY)xxD motif